MAAPSQRGHRGDSRSGASSGASVQAVGLREWRKELKALEDGRALTLEFARENRAIAKKAASWAQDEANSMGGPFAHFAKMIKGKGGAAGAKIGIDPTANAVFWGAKKRTGWNARNPQSKQQFPDWVGASWDTAVKGQGPYAINPALADHLDDIAEMYGDAIDRIAKKAFPDK